MALAVEALRGLADRGLCRPEPHSLLCPFATTNYGEEQIALALEQLRDDGGLIGEPAVLAPAMGAALDLLANPVRRIRVVRLHAGRRPLALVTDSDGASAVTLLSDARDVVFTPLVPLSEVTARIVSVIAGEAPALVRGPRAELLAAEVFLLGIVHRLTEPGALSAEALSQDIFAHGGRASTSDAKAALDGLVTEGWLERAGDGFVRATRATERWWAIAGDDVADVELTLFGDETHAARFHHRFTCHGPHVWEQQPFLAGHDLPAAEDASLGEKIGTYTGVAFVPLSLSHLEQQIAGILGQAPATHSRKNGRRQLVSLG